MNFQEYRHIIPIQIRFSDIDRLNHVNNACYLNYFELGRVKYFNETLQNHINWNEKGFILARTEIDHIIPVLLNDEIYCCTKIIKIGTKSITFKNSVIKKINNEMVECASGIGILVAMDYIKNISIEVPEKWAELFNKFES